MSKQDKTKATRERILRIKINQNGGGSANGHLQREGKQKHVFRRLEFHQPPATESNRDDKDTTGTMVSLSDGLSIRCIDL